MKDEERILVPMAYRPRDWKSHPPYLHPPYKSTTLRGPTQPLIPVNLTLSEKTGPAPDHSGVGEIDADLTRNARAAGEPLGERITVSGKVMDQRGDPVCNSLIEIWQANAAGRYIHKVDQHDAPVDPNFFGAGRCITDDHGNYRFLTIKPGAYPWGNHDNAWRPSHIHFSLFGPNISTRLVTQMYFPGDPLLPLDPIFNFTEDDEVKNRLVSRFSIEQTQPGWALAYEFDIVLRGPVETPMEGS